MPQIFIALFIAAIFVFEVFKFVNVIRSKAVIYNACLVWILGTLLIHPFVAIAYYFTDYKNWYRHAN
jgi:predicted membrane protein